MTIPQKIKAALTGGKDERSILMREPHELILLYILQNPSISDGEILRIVKNRRISHEVIDRIAKNREWTRNGQIRLAIVTNPKSPPQIAMRFMSMLKDKELRNLARSKDVTALVSAKARKLLMYRGQM